MRLFPIFLCCLLLTGCASQSVPAAVSLPSLTETIPESATTAPAATEQETIPVDPVRQMISDMSLEQRVGQLFLARCSADTAVEDVQKYHLGGLVLFGDDFEGQTPEIP